MPKPRTANPRATHARPGENEIIGPKEAAATLGVSVSTVRRLWDAKLLRGFMPAPRCLNLYRASVEQLRVATEDPEFWSKHKLN